MPPYLKKERKMSVELKISEEVKDLMDEKGILEEDVQAVVDYAEEGNKLVDEETGRCLAKKLTGAFTVYAEYEMDADAAKIINVYSHRVLLGEDKDN